MKYFILFTLICIYSCGDQTKNTQTVKNPLYDKAFDFKDRDEIDSAFYYFYKAKDGFLQQKDSFGAAKCLANIAIIQETKGDFFGSQETGLTALNYFDTKDSLQFKYLSINYNTLGIASSKLQDYKKAVEFYQKSISFAPDDSDKMIYENNLANSYSKTKNYNEALKILSQTLKSGKNKDHNYARALANFAKTKWLQKPDYNPVPEFQQALHIRLTEKDAWGMNASYSHLADYYTGKMPDSALLYARKMYETATALKSADDKIEALQKLISLENPQNSHRYFKVYQNLNDSLQTARNKAKNQFALIRYETEKNKADFLKAKTESTERQNKIVIRNIVLIGLLILIALGYFYFTKRQKRLQQEKLLEVKNTELKYSKKVHDRVANRIYQIMSQVENTDDIDRDALLFGLENVYETSRDISYDNKEINENQNFSDQLLNMIDSYASNSVKTLLSGNNEKIWESVSFHHKTEVYLILQEMMTNMKKHSKADKVFIKFHRAQNTVNISYTDNGVGFKDQIRKNGLQNMENRINSINGKINFDTETKNLLKINFSFPV